MSSPRGLPTDSTSPMKEGVRPSPTINTKEERTVTDDHNDGEVCTSTSERGGSNHFLVPASWTTVGSGGAVDLVTLAGVAHRPPDRPKVWSTSGGNSSVTVSWLTGVHGFGFDPGTTSDKDSTTPTREDFILMPFVL